MDEMNNTMPAQGTVPSAVMGTVQPAGAGSITYAPFFERLVAVIIDGILVGAASGIISGIFRTMGDTGSTIGGLIAAVGSVAYYVYFLSKFGQTLGKKAMHIRVQNEVTGANLDPVTVILREVVGKTISGIVLFLGYFWMLWDSKKQTWHDKIAKSVVVKVS